MGKKELLQNSNIEPSPAEETPVIDDYLYGEQQLLQKKTKQPSDILEGERQYYKKVSTTPVYKKGLEPTFREGVNLTSRFDVNLSPAEVQEYNRAENQPWRNKLINGVVSRGLSIIPKTVQGIGHVGGFLYELGDYAYQGLSENPDLAKMKDWSKIWDNQWSDLMSKADEGLRNKLPVYGDKRYYEGNILQVMGTAKFWFDDALDAVAFATSAYLPGAAFGAISPALGLVDKVGKLTKLGKAIQLTESTVYNSISEAGFEARDTGDRSRNEYSQQMYSLPFDQLNEIQKSEVKMKVAPHQAETFMMNMGILAIPNYVQSRFFHGGFGENADKLRDLVRTGKISADDVKVFQNAFKQMFTGMITEGPWEEGSQNAVQAYEERRASGKTDMTTLPGVAEEWMQGWHITDQQKGMILGSLIGGPMGFVSGMRGSIAEREAIKGEKIRQEMQVSVLDKYDKLFVEYTKQPWKTFDKQVTYKNEEGENVTEIVQSYVDKDGHMEMDPVKVNKMFYSRVNDKFFFDESTVAALKGDELHAKMVNDDALARRFFWYMSAVDVNGSKIFQSTDEAITALKERELQFPDEFAPEGIQKGYTQGQLYKLKSIYDQVQKQMLDEKDFEKDLLRDRFKLVMTKTLFGEAVKRQTLSDMKIMTRNEQSLTELDNLIKDSQTLTDEFLGTKTKERLFKRFQEEVSYRTDLRKKLDDLRAEKEPNQEAIKDAEFDLNEYNYIAGKEPVPNTIFPYSVDPARLNETMREHGARNQYYFNIGMDALVDQKVDNMIRETEKGTVAPIDVINGILDSNEGRTRVRSEDIDKVDKMLRDEGDRVRDLTVEAQKAQEWINENPETIIVSDENGIPDFDHPVPNPMPNYTEDRIVRDKIIADSNKRTQDLELALSRMDDLKKQVIPQSERKRFTSRQAEERYFKRQYGDAIVNKAETIRKTYESNKKVYSNSKEVDDTLRKLNEIKRMYDKEPRQYLLNSKEFKGFIESIDKAISQLKDIATKVEKNRIDREVIDQRSKTNDDIASFLSIGVSVNMDSKTPDISDSELYNVVRDVVGQDFLDSVFEQIKKSDHPFDRIYVDLIIDQIKVNEEQDRVLKFLKGKRDNETDKFVKLFNSLGVIKRTKGVAWNKLIDNYKRAPFKTFDLLISIIAGKYTKISEDPAPLDIFKRNKDSIELYSAIKRGEPVDYTGITREELLGILSQHIKVLSVINLQDNLLSKNKIADQVQTEIGIIKNKTQAPSNQQIISLRQAVALIGKKFSQAKERYGSWIYLKGLSGTGKTSFFSYWLMRSLGMKSNEYLAVSTSQRSMKELEDSIQSEHKPILSTELKKEDITEEIKYIFLDEVGRLSDVRLNDIAQIIADINSERKEPVIVIATGDPTQVNERGDSIPAIADPSEQKSRIQELSPLTAIFRAFNSALIYVQDMFQDNFRQVTTLTTKATGWIGQPSDGVHVSSDSKALLNQLNIHKDNNRSKVIVVYDEVDKRNYESARPFAEVLTYLEVSGIQFDEVYVDINPKNFATNVKGYNDATYTALGRARQYIFIKDYTGKYEYEIDEDVRSKNTKGEQDQRILDNYLDRLEFEESVLSGKMPKARSRNIMQQEIEKEDLEDILEPQTDSVDDYTNAPDTPQQSPEDAGEWLEVSVGDVGVHDIAYPSHAPIKQIDRQDNSIARVTKGARILYLKVKNEDTGKYEVHIIAHEMNIDGTEVSADMWHEIGVMSDEELKETSLGQYLARKLKEATVDGRNVGNGLSRIKEGKLKIGEDKAGATILLKGTVHKARPLQYVYDPKYRDSGPGMINRIKDLFNKAFSFRRKESLTYSLHIYKDNETLPDGTLAKNSNVVPGIPHLVIERRTTTKEGKERVSKWQFVRLAPRRLRSSDSNVRYLTEFRDAVKSINDLGIGRFGDPEVNELITRFRRDYETKDGEIISKSRRRYTWTSYQKDRSNGRLVEITHDQFNQLAKLTEPIIKLFYGPGESEVVTTIDDMWDDIGQELKTDREYEYTFVPFRNSDEGRVRRTNIKKPTEWDFVTKSDKPVPLEGKAQVALDWLAKANGSVEGYRFRSRRVWRRGTEGKKNRYYTAAKSLLTSKSPYMGKYLEYIRSLLNDAGDIVVEKNLEAQYNQILKDIKSKNLTVDENIKRAEDFIVDAVGMKTRVELEKEKTEDITPSVTLEELDAILNFDKDGDHPGLFYPLDYRTFNDLAKNMDENERDLEDLLVSNLKDILPTRIQVTTDVKEKPEKTIIETVKKETKGFVNDIKKEINDLNKRGRSLRSGTGEELGIPLTFEETRKQARIYLPNITDDELKFLGKIQMVTIAGEPDLGHFLDGVMYFLKNEDNTVYRNVLRHEVMHKIFHEFLTRDEQIRLFDAFTKEFPAYKNKGLVEIEEAIAKKWQLWNNKKLTITSEIIRRFFNWLAKHFGFINRNVDNIERFFKTIESGYFVDSSGLSVGVRRRMKDINEKYGDPKLTSYRRALKTYKDSRELVQKTFHKLLDEGFHGFPITRHELQSLAQQEIEGKLKSYTEGYEGVRESMSDDERMDTEYILDIYQKSLKYYKELIRDVYPHWNFNSTGEIIIDSELTTEEIVESIEEDRNGIMRKKYGLDNDQMNLESRLTQEIKDLLSYIPIGKGYMGWREAYLRTLQLMEGVEVGDDNFVELLGQSWESLGSNERTKVVMEHIIDQYARSISTEGSTGMQLPVNMKFVDENIFIWHPKDISRIYGETGVQVRKDEGAKILKRQEGWSTERFILEIETEFRDKVNRQDLTDIFIKSQNLNLIRGLHNNFVSQKKKNLYIAEIEQEYGLFKMTYMPAPGIGPRDGLVSFLKDAIRDRFPDVNSLTNFKSRWLQEHKNDKPKLFVQSFLVYLNAGHYASTLPDKNIGIIQQDILEFFNRDVELIVTKKIKDRIPLDKENPEEGEFEPIYYDINDAIDSKKTLFNRLADSMNISSQFIRATSVRDVAGKKRYFWNLSSQANDTIFNMANNRQYGTGNMNLPVRPFLKTRFFGKNIFVSRKNKIHGVVDHNGIVRSSGGYESNTLYRKEGVRDFISRTFVFGFIDRIRSTAKGKEKYFQWVYPNERKNITGAEVNVLTPKEIKDVLGSMIEQVSLRNPEYESSLENYDITKLTNFDILKDVLGNRDLRSDPIKSSEIPGLVDKVYDQFIKIANELTDQIIFSQVEFDADISQNYKLDRFIDKNLFPLWNRKDLQNIGNQTKIMQTWDSFREEQKSLHGLFKTQRDYLITRNQILPLAFAYTANEYVNSYNLNQLLMGDYAQFKDGSDVLRRHSTSTAPGYKSLVHERMGMRDKFKVLIVKDIIFGVDDVRSMFNDILSEDEKKNIDVLLSKIEKKFAEGDGAGFMLPERFEELQFMGFNSEYILGNILKPQIYDINEDGIERSIKYSSIVLSDDIIKQFPSLSVLRDNMRRIDADEMVFNSALKVGNLVKSLRSSPVDLLTNAKYEINPKSIIELSNRNYRIQQNPISDIDSAVSQPSQLLYLMRIFESDKGQARDAYDALAEIIRMGSDKFFKDTDTDPGIRKKLLNILQNSKGNEKLYEMVISGLSLNFPALSDKIITHLSAHLDKNTVGLTFPGTHLVLQTAYGVRKYGQVVDDTILDKGRVLRFRRDAKGRLYAEVIIPRGLLTPEHEAMIEESLEKMNDPDNLFELPDLLGFRIPSSEIHSAVALKVSGFYDSKGTNVLIAPKLLIALHGHDFDVDALFTIRREWVDNEETSKKEYVGYTWNNKKKTYTFNKGLKDTFVNDEVKIKYLKNIIYESMLDTVSRKDNVLRMLSAIPIQPLVVEQERVNKLLRRDKEVDYDLSNINDQIRAHSDIFEADIAIGILGNAAKSIAYMLRTGKDGVDPSIIKKENKIDITIDDVPYDTISSTDKEGGSLFENIDGLMNAALDNTRLKILPSLNIWRNTINGYIALRALGMPTELSNNFILQPALRDYAESDYRGKRKAKDDIQTIKGFIYSKLGTKTPELEGVKLTSANLLKDIKKFNSVYDVPEGDVTKETDQFLRRQLLVLDTFIRAEEIGSDITEMAFFLRIAKTFPKNKQDLDQVIERKNKIFGQILSDNGSIPEDEKQKFSLDITNFFVENPHIYESYKTLEKYHKFVNGNINKYSPAVTEFIDNLLKTSNLAVNLGNWATNKYKVRDEFIHYLLSSYLYTKDSPIMVKGYPKLYRKGDMVLSGPRAFNQHFCDKIKLLKNLFNDNHIDNRFVSNLDRHYFPSTKMYEVRFVGGTDMDGMNLLDFRDAFYQLNQVDFTWNEKSDSWNVKLLKEPLPDDQFSDFQKEFVAYGIMNFGLSFGAMNYTMAMPEELFAQADKLLNDLLSEFIAPQNADNLNGIREHFEIELAANHGNKIKVHDQLPVPTGQDSEGKNIYAGFEDGFYYDRKFNNEEHDIEKFPKYIHTRFQRKDYVYVRLNNPEDSMVYYQQIGRINPFKHYNLSESVIDNGYLIREAFGLIDPQTKGPVRNFPVRNLNQNTFEYYGDDIKVGEIVTLTELHDTSRINKQYATVTKRSGKIFTVEPVKKITRDDARFNKSVASIVEGLKKRLTAKSSPFWYASGGRIMAYKLRRFGESRMFKNDINREFNNSQVLREVNHSYGVEIVIDTGEIEKYISSLDGEQLDLFSQKYENIDSDELVVASRMIEWKEPVKVSDDVIRLRSTYQNDRSVLDIFDEIIERRKDGDLKNLLKSLRSRVERMDLKIDTLHKLEKGRVGLYSPNGIIYFDPENAVLHGLTSEDKVDRILAHEIIHGVTTNAYIENEGFRSKIDKIYDEFMKSDEVKKELEKISRDVNVIGYGEPFYGIRGPREMIAEVFTNPQFAAIMDQVESTIPKVSWLRRVINALLDLLGLRNESMRNTLGRELIKLVQNDAPFVGKFTQVGHQLYQDSQGIMYKADEDFVTVGDQEGVEEEPGDDLDKQILEMSSKLSIQKDENGKEKDTYINNESGKLFNRVTKFISYFLNRGEENYAESTANEKWKGIEHDHKLSSEWGDITYDEYLAKSKDRILLGSSKGRIIHLKLKDFFNKFFKLGLDSMEIQKEIRNISAETEGRVLPEHYSFLDETETLRAIFYNVGINILDKCPANLKDKMIMPEVTTWSDLLQLATTADILVHHADDTYSIIDWKTGSTFNRRYMNDILKYGIQDILIGDNQRDRAKLEVMMRAFIFKLNFPDMKFRDLQVAWIPWRSQAKREDIERFVEVPSYLKMIETFFKDKTMLEKYGFDPKIYEKLTEKSKNIFSPSEYTDKVAKSLVDEILTSRVRPEQLLNQKVNELTILLGGKESFQALPYTDREKAAKLWNEIASLRADPSMQLDLSLQHDVGKFVEWFGNYSDISMDQVKVFAEFEDQQRNRYRFFHEERLNKFQSLLDPVMKDYLKGKFKVKIWGKTQIANIKYQDAFGWAFKSFEHHGYQKRRLLIPTDDEYNKITESQRKLLDYMNADFKSWFVGDNAYAKQIGALWDIRGVETEMSYLDLLNTKRNKDEQFEYYDGWFPKVMKTMTEVSYEHGVKFLTGKTTQDEKNVFMGTTIGAFTPGALKERVLRKLTHFEEDNYEMYNEPSMALPWRYIGSLNQEVNNDYTMNLEFMYDRFTKSTLWKQYMDPVYATGQALKQFLLMKKNGQGQPMFENTIGFLEMKLMGNILDKRMRQKWSRTPLKIKYKDASYDIHIDKIIQTMMGWTSATVMWMRPWQGTGNALHAKGLTYREAIKGSIASSFLHIDGNAIDFKLEDNAFADKEYFTKFLPDLWKGDIRKNKMWLLAKHLDYIPDNFDYATNRRFLLSERNAIINESNMYLFHSKGEEYTSLTTMTAQLHHLKNPVDGKSLYDSYEVVQNPETMVYEVVWKGGVRGLEKRGAGTAVSYDQITDLTTHEIMKLKKVHERMQGGYRREEAANIELYVLGKALIQFKKYLPRLLMNAMHGKRYEMGLGYYKESGERKIDPETGKLENVYEWVQRMNEGRWRTVINSLLAVLHFGNRDYKWANLSTEQKQNVVDAVLGVGMLIMAYTGYLMMFRNEDDDDTMKKWYYNYLVNNLNQQYNPMDLLNTLESASRPVSFARAVKATQGFANFMMATANLMVGNEAAAFTQDGHLKGWIELQRSLPYVASYYDFISKMQHNKTLEPWWVNKFENKWR